MRMLPTMEAIWRSGDYVGPQRPMARVTVQHPKMALRTYGLMSTYSYITSPPRSGTVSINPLDGLVDPRHGRKVSNTYADLLFTSPNPPRELPNVKSVTWSRSLDSDAATLTLTLYNTVPRSADYAFPVGTSIPEDRRDLDFPGYYTPTRGKSRYSSRWGHTANEWYGMLLPDNVIRTYEGYGFNPSVIPEQDPHLVQTGVWLIDSVEMDALGLITVTARDLARLLLDQQTNQPVIPRDFDPLTFEDWQTDSEVTDPDRTRMPLKVSDHSNRYGPIKDPEGELHDLADPDNYRHHHPQDVLDDNPATYWMSVAHTKPNWRWATEWIEVSCKPATLDQFGAWLVGHGYTVYLSVYADGHWVAHNGAGGSTLHVPWGVNPTNPDRDQQAWIPYVTSFIAGSDWSDGLSYIQLDKPIKNVTKVRFSFRNLQHLPGITPLTHSYRAGVRQIVINAAPGTTTEKVTPGPAGSNPGRYADYTDVIKLACAWAGLFWPSTAYEHLSNGTHRTIRFTRADPVLGAVNGRVWGDFEETGTSGVVRINSEELVNKSLMDVITNIRNIIGFLFFVDETGAAQWRLPNVYDVGNWITDNTSTVGRTVTVRSLDEKQVLMSVGSTLNSRNVFEIIRVSNLNPAAKAGIASTYNPNPIGLRRVGLWNEDRFTAKELQRVADMTAAAALWLYRTDRIKIPGFPGIQVDDQVRIFERVTNEGNIHYIKAIQSTNDLEAGEWTYDLDTQWLGDNPATKWAIPKAAQPKYVLTHLTQRPLRTQLRKTVVRP